MSMPTRGGYMRSLASRSLSDRCTITDPGTAGRTPSGGTIAGTPTTYPDIPCRLAAAGSPGALQRFGEQLVSTADRELLLAPGTPIAAGWRVDVAGTRYSVIGAIDGATDHAVAHALLRRMEGI